MPRKNIFLIFLIIFSSAGCAASMVRHSPGFSTEITHVKRIVVMPPTVEVYKLNAGGVRELIDDWSESSKKYFEESLKAQLEKQYGFELIMADEADLKKNHRELWDSQKGLYEAVTVSALSHAYPGPDTFEAKVKKFDYTMGAEIAELSKLYDADALLFLHGIDHEATADRNALLCWNVLVGAVTGVTMIPTNPTFVALGLVDAKSGDILWLNTNAPGTEYSLRNKKSVNGLVESLTRKLFEKK